MKFKNISKIFIVLALALSGFATYSQTKTTGLSTGYKYATDYGSSTKLSYRVSYRTDNEGNYISKYKVYFRGTHQIDIIATHFKSRKEIKVEVAEAGGGLLSTLNEENQTYETPSLKAFGFRGVAGILGGARVPNQLSIRFLSNSFTYVKVINVLGYHEGEIADFYVLN